MLPDRLYLMCHAPDVPDWFMPIMRFEHIEVVLEDREKEFEDFQFTRMIKWAEKWSLAVLGSKDGI